MFSRQRACHIFNNQNLWRDPSCQLSCERQEMVSFIMDKSFTRSRKPLARGAGYENIYPEEIAFIGYSSRQIDVVGMGIEVCREVSNCIYI